MDGMEGFIPAAGDPKDLNTATIKGVFINVPNSPITKSPRFAVFCILTNWCWRYC